MIRKIAITIIAFLALITLSSCSNYKSKDSVATYGTESTLKTEMSRSAGGIEMEVAFDEPTISGNSQNIETEEKKLIFTGSLNIQVSNLSETEAMIHSWVESCGGYISENSEDMSNLFIIVRIPTVRFQEAMATVSGFGKVEHRSITAEDVSEQYYDMHSRLETRKILRERLQGYLSTAENMKSLMAVETELNNVQSDIESMEGRFRRLSNRIDYATITIRAFLPNNTTEAGFIYPNLPEKARDLMSNTLEFFASFVFLILYIVIYGIPIVLLVAALYWLLLGRIGILRKLFALLGNKKSHLSTYSNKDTQ